MGQGGRNFGGEVREVWRMLVWRMLVSDKWPYILA